MSPANNAEDGVIDRLAKRLFASPGSPFTAFADKQRTERLEECGHFQRVLKACKSARDAERTNGTIAEEAVPTSSETKAGARISRFFKWNPPDGEKGRGDDAAPRADGGALSEAAASFRADGGGARDRTERRKALRYSEDCSIETHELWACRALALGCGNHVGDLRNCWSEAAERKERRALAGTRGEMTFEGGGDGSCQSIQLAMANCVNRNAAELAERMQAARKR